MTSAGEVEKAKSQDMALKSQLYLDNGKMCCQFLKFVNFGSCLFFFKPVFFAFRHFKSLFCDRCYWILQFMIYNIYCIISAVLSNYYFVYNFFVQNLILVSKFIATYLRHFFSA